MRFFLRRFDCVKAKKTLLLFFWCFCALHLWSEDAFSQIKEVCQLFFESRYLFKLKSFPFCRLLLCARWRRFGKCNFHFYLSSDTKDGPLKLPAIILSCFLYQVSHVIKPPPRINRRGMSLRDEGVFIEPQQVKVKHSTWRAISARKKLFMAHWRTIYHHLYFSWHWSWILIRLPKRNYDKVIAGLSQPRFMWRRH